jgi:hypothetical protein
VEQPGPLTQHVLRYQDTMKQLVPTVREPGDWAPLASLVDVDHFERIGTAMEVQNWREYTELLTGWAGHVDQFETTVHRISELPDVVYFAVQERHFGARGVTTVNSLSMFEFNSDSLIRRLSVYLQQAR